MARFYIAALFFFLPAANGYRMWLVTLPFELLFAVLLFSARLSERDSFWTLRRESHGLDAVLFLWVMAALLSTVANANEQTFVAYVSGYLAPFALYVLIGNPALGKTDLSRILVSMSAGASIPLLHGIYRYYTEWGIPDAPTLLLSRYDLTRMEPYMQATFGSTGNTAALLCILIPPLICLLLDKAVSFKVSLWSGVFLLIAATNMLIVQSIAAFLVMTLFTLIAIVKISTTRAKRTIAVAVFSISLLVLVLLSIEILSKRLEAVVAVFDYLSGRMGTHGPEVDSGDQSPAVRFESMAIGWEIFLNNPWFGVGPDFAWRHNPHYAAHQFNIQQASTLGIMGLVFSTLLCLHVFGRFLVLLRYDLSVPDYAFRFCLLSGPAMFLLYGVGSNVPLSSGSVNTWAALFFCLLAIAGFGGRESEGESRLVLPGRLSGQKQWQH